MPQPQKFGKTERMSYSKIETVLPMPNLIQIQKDSYDWFINEGLAEVFEDISPIRDYADNLALEFVDHYIADTSKYNEEECKDRDATYSAPLKVRVRLINQETGEVKEQEVFMGDFPIMTEKGTFIYNGAERAVVTQLVRSPGPYYEVSVDKSNNKLFAATIIPNRGAWLEYETDSNEIISVRVDRTRKQPVTALIRALAYNSVDAKIAHEKRKNPTISEEELRKKVRRYDEYRTDVASMLREGSNEELRAVFGADDRLEKSIAKDTTRNYDEGLKEIYRKLRPGEPATFESAYDLIEVLFFDSRRYDLAKVGRYKYNKKLGLRNRIAGCTLAEDVANAMTGEIIFEKGAKLSRFDAEIIENAGPEVVWVESKVEEGKSVKVIGNNFVDLSVALADCFGYKGFNPTEHRLPNQVFFPAFRGIMNDYEANHRLPKRTKKAEQTEHIANFLYARRDELSPKHIIFDDIIASISYLLGLTDGIGQIDDIDHLGNRRLRTVGELLQNQFRIGLARMERVVKERMTIQDIEATTPQALMNIRPVTAAIKEFFGSSQLSQFMDQTNPLAELTHKRRLSALGPGGLSRDRAGFEVRDVHHSHYGRMCPIETPEGPNIGLIGSLTTYGMVNEYGFIETPYRRVDKNTGIVTSDILYLAADEEEPLIVAQANEPLDKDGRFVNQKVLARGFLGEIDLYDREVVDCMDVSPRQVVSIATAMIPFLENDDANRALMGSNMQRQAVPLLVTDSPIVATGVEYAAARDSGVVVLAENAGTVTYVDSTRIVVEREDGEGKDTYKLLKFKRSNQGTCINQRPIVNCGEPVKEGEVIADGPSTNMGEISLGRNLLVGFMTWEGFNYEDAIILNEKLLTDDILTSIHIEEYESEARDTKLGPEEITRDIPNVGDDVLKDLDEFGIVRIGAEVDSSDILVGKVTPKGETELTAEERLLRAIFGEKAREVRDTSLRVPHGEAGIVVDVKVFSRENGDDLSPGVNQMVRCYVATKRKIQIGDKMAGRHGNKGVISQILPVEEMPFMNDGTPLEVMLNPLGVPSRMNIGQVLEVHLGLAAKKKGWYISTPVFDGASELDVIDLLKQCGYPENGKLMLRDGRTGDYFDHPVTVGYMYMLKLHHLVDDKIHARSTGPYSLVTQQPLGGKAQFGGQRFGEMEVWALEAYGAAYTLQEILTVKSDDVIGRVKTYEAIVKNENIPEPGIPESFKVLIKEMQALALDVKVLDEDEHEIEVRDGSDLEANTNFNAVEFENVRRDEDFFGYGAGFTETDEEGEAVEHEIVESSDEDDDFDDYDNYDEGEADEE
ncbi:MAG: DNA-directed RNA polymerase subunit beta [Clostridiales bacterium]|nr:DNA-directed RNA polymerase subunit beta [Clostridiales bacterium]